MEKIKKYWGVIKYIIFLIPAIIGLVSTIQYEFAMYGILGGTVGLLLVFLIGSKINEKEEMF